MIKISPIIQNPTGQISSYKQVLPNPTVTGNHTRLFSRDELPASLFTPASLLIKEIDQAERARFSASKQVLTFREFLEETVKNPQKYLRNASQYAVDAIDYWNKASGIDENQKIKILGHEVKPFAFATRPWEPEDLVEKTGVCGQELVLQELYNILKINAKKDHPERLILLHGPNATGKSVITEILFEGLEEYSKTNEGALYTFNWVFRDDDEFGDFGLCFPAHSGKNAIKPTSDDLRKLNENAVVIPANLNTNPIFLLDQGNRMKLLKIIEENGNLPPDFNKDYVIAGNLDSSSKKIFDALWKLYDGKFHKILKHVQVVRWTLSKQNHQGLVMIPPEDSPEAHLNPITPKIDWDSLPRKIREAFRAAGLHELSGTFPLANRGHVCYDNMLKSGDIGRYLFLLGTAEKGEISISSRGESRAADEKLDVIIWGTTNDVNVFGLQTEYPDWETLRERLTLLPVGYEKRYRSIANIFSDQLSQMISQESNRHISPHVLETFSLWIAMTYLFPASNEKHYEKVDEDPSKPLKEQVKKMDLLHKALLYQGEDINSYELDHKKQKFTPGQQNLLKRYLKEIADEYNLGVGKSKFLFYEGGSGLSIREARIILNDAIKSKPKECLSILEVFDELEEWIKEGLDYEEDRKARVGIIKEVISEMQRAKVSTPSLYLPDFSQNPPSNLLTLAKNHAGRQIRYEVHNVLGFIKSKQEHVNNLRKYIEHVKAYRAKNIVADPYREPSNSNQPNERFMRNMEKIFDPNNFSDPNTEYGRNDYRRDRLQDLTLWDGNKQGLDPMSNLDKIFPGLIEKLTDKDMVDNKEKLYDFLYDLRVYFARKDAFQDENITEKMKERIELLQNGLKGLKELGYCEKCIPKIIDFAFSDEEYKKALASGRKPK